MKRLWAPWRMAYIRREKSKGCLFCDKPTEGTDSRNLILFQGKRAFVIMNRFPYNSGHLMIVPRRHCLNLEELEKSEVQELFELSRLSLEILKATFRPQGFNIGVNIGRAAGAGEEHLHVHIVPRWAGDTNFMPVLGEAKVMPEYLDETYRRLRYAFETFKQGRERRKGGRKR